MPYKPPSYRPSIARPAQPKGSTTERGYGSRWQHIRLVVLNAEPLCRLCAQADPPRVEEATCVDHIVPKCQGGTDDAENLQPLCALCNAKKSVSDRAGRA